MKANPEKPFAIIGSHLRMETYHRCYRKPYGIRIWSRFCDDIIISNPTVLAELRLRWKVSPQAFEDAIVGILHPKVVDLPDEYSPKSNFDDHLSYEYILYASGGDIRSYLSMA